MRRALPVLAIMIAACAAQPPERAPLPDVAELLPEFRGCQLSVGDPIGVVVVSVISEAAADGLLETDDVITAIDATPVATRSDLFDALGGHRPGETIQISFTRGSEDLATPVTLGSTPDDPGRPRIGVTIQTAFETIGVDEATQTLGPSQTTRVIEVAEQLMIFDPLDRAWQRTGVVPPNETRWVATSTGFYSVTADDPARVLDLIANTALPDDGFQGWSARRLIGGIGENLLVVVTAEIEDRPGFVNVGIAAFDPRSRETKWVTPVSSAFGVPVEAYGSFDGTAFVAVGNDLESGEPVTVTIFDAEGNPSTSTNLVELGTPVGWFDGRSMAFRSSEQVLTVYDFGEAATETYDLPENLGQAAVAAVGDGRSVIAVEGRSLVVQDITEEADAIPLASNCVIGRAGDPGWGT